VADAGKPRQDGRVADRHRLSEREVAGWLLKTSAPLDELAAGWEPGGTRSLERCLRASYRLDLMRPGQPCLLWLSGRVQPGVHAVGTLTGRPRTDGGQPSVPVSLRRLEHSVGRADLLRSAAFADAEVLRMPAGSNPSYVTAVQLAEVLALAGPGRHRIAS
jgi:hypothetical protein